MTKQNKPSQGGNQLRLRDLPEGLESIVQKALLVEMPGVNNKDIPLSYRTSAKRSFLKKMRLFFYEAYCLGENVNHE